MLISLCGVSAFALDCNDPKDFEAFLQLLKTNGFTTDRFLENYRGLWYNPYLSKEAKEYLDQLQLCSVKEQLAERDRDRKAREVLEAIEQKTKNEKELAENAEQDMKRYKTFIDELKKN